MVPIIQSSLYFYYQNFYVRTLNSLLEEQRLAYVIGGEIADDGEVHEKVLTYIVEKYCENPEWEFETDEELLKLKILFEGAASDAKSAAATRKKFYKDNFKSTIKLRKSFFWNLLVFLADLTVIVLIIWYVDYLFYNKEELELKSNKEKDPAKKAKLDDDLRQIITSVQFWIMGICWLVNLLPVTDTCLKILSKGWRGIYHNFGQVLQSISVVLIFCFFTLIISIPVGDKKIGLSVILEMDTLYGLAATFVCVKILTLMLQHGSKVKIIKVLFDVLAKGFVLCKPLYAMFFYAHLIFAAFGMDLFGGVVDSTSAEKYKKNTGGSLDPGASFLNFNDYWCALWTLFTVIFGGWNGTDNIVLSQNVKRYDKWFYEYFFVVWYFWSNLFLINIVASFVVDNVMLAIGEFDGSGGEEEAAPDAEEGEGQPLTAEIEMAPVEIDVDVNANVNYPAPPGPSIQVDLTAPPIEVELEVEAPVDVELEVEAPTIEVELDAPEVEVEVEVDAPEVEIEVDAPEVEAEVEIEVDAPEVEAEVEVEVDADVEVEVDAEVQG